MNKKWIIYIVLIVVAFVLIVVFSKNIYSVSYTHLTLPTILLV